MTNNKKSAEQSLPLFWKLTIKLINCFKTFVDKLIKRPQLITVGKKTLFLSMPYLGEIFLQTRTKLRKYLKGLLNSCELDIVFKSQKKLSIFSVSKNTYLFI